MIEGIALFIFLAVYIYMLLKREQTGISDNSPADLKDANESKSSLLLMFFLVAGIVALYFGSGWFLKGAVDLGKNTFGLSEKIIGVTIVAFGTSAPELAASIIAAYRKQTDIALGNLVGSNIFNIGAVLGLTSIITPLKTKPEIMNYDILWMLGIAIILFPLMIFKKKLSIISGLVLFGLYVSYISLQLF
jgi:cation:H+ antiporter